MGSSGLQIDFDFEQRRLAGSIADARDTFDTQHALEPVRTGLTLDRFRAALRRPHIVNVPSHFGGPINERTVSLPYSAADEKLIELPLKLLCLRQNEKAAHFSVETLSDVKGGTKGKADVMKDVLQRIIYSRVNRYTCRFVHNHKLIILMSDRRRPIHRRYGESLRLKVHANILPGRQSTI